MREKRVITRRNTIIYLGMGLSLVFFSSSLHAQFFDNYYQQYQDPYAAQQQYYQELYRNQNQYMQYDPREAEAILREQNQRARERMPQHQQYAQPNAAYDNYYGHRIQDEEQVRSVMAEARQIGSFIKNKNGKPFVIMDKRNFQFYLYDAQGRLLRIGPVAIGKGKTHVGAFETPVGVFPIKSKVPVDDWIRPDWYFVEEGEPIPTKWEDRRVPGFFRYKLVFDGSRYIHYAEATGGRLTHGCLGLDWQDAEAVYHTLQVGSYCIIIDQPLLTRLARGEFPIQKPPVAKKPADEASPVVAEKAASERKSARSEQLSGDDDKVLRNLW